MHSLTVAEVRFRDPGSRSDDLDLVICDRAFDPGASHDYLFGVFVKVMNDCVICTQVGSLQRCGSCGRSTTAEWLLEFEAAPSV